MKLTKQNLYIYMLLLILCKHCYGVGFFNNTTIFRLCGNKEAVQAAAPIVANVAEKGVVMATKVQTGLTSVGTGIGTGLKTGLMYVGIGIGAGLAAVAVVGGGYYGYRLYCKRCAKIEQLRLAHEIFEREIRIKEEQAHIAAEQARIALEIMKRNAKIRNGIIIGVTATVASVGLGYAGYHLYKSIVAGRQQKKQEQDLFAAKNRLLDALAAANHDEIGKFELPTSCTPHACKLLALKDGKPALDEIVRSYHMHRPQILQQAGTPVAILAQPN